MKKFELIFIPNPGLSHLVSTVETAKRLLNLDSRLAITVLIMKPFSDDSGKALDDYIQKISFTKTTPYLRFINLSLDENFKLSLLPDKFFTGYIRGHSDSVRRVVSDLINQQKSQISGLVLDLFCTNFIDLGNEFNLPSYVFFTSGASSLCLFNGVVSLKNSELSVRSFSERFPPVFVEDCATAGSYLDLFRRIKDTKGIMVNTFQELETHAIESLISSNSPKIYPVGPILHPKNESNAAESEIIQWLDNQPDKSVVFVCFGSLVSLDESQVKIIATGLENSGNRFLWSLRKPAAKGAIPFPVEYENLEEVLPEGFLERTKGVGKIIGWAPQVAVLSHRAVGGFVSHCGWNSTLESIWFEVPILTFPGILDQQINAFLLVEELGVAEKIRIDNLLNFKEGYERGFFRAEEIEAAIRRLMAAEGDGVRGKLKELKEKSRMALEEGGSSYKSLIMFIVDVIRNIE